ncbi:MAG: hypothetical protein ACLSVD_10995 [Eggerthellaceae bacterium]
MGTALTTWLAPVAAVAFGWRMAVKRTSCCWRRSSSEPCWAIATNRV